LATVFPLFQETDGRYHPSALSFLTKAALATQLSPQGSQAEQSAAEQRNCRTAIGDRLYCGSGLDGLACFNGLEKSKRGNCGQDE